MDLSKCLAGQITLLFKTSLFEIINPYIYFIGPNLNEFLLRTFHLTEQWAQLC